MESLLKEIAFHSALSLSLSFGYELGLFDALSAIGSQENPASPKQVADKAGMDVEVIKVWLMGMHSGKIIKANEAGDGYWIEKENLKALSSNEPAIGLILTRIIPHIAPHYKQALETAKSKKSECQKDQHKDHDGDHEHGKKTEHGHLWQEHAQHQHSHKHGHGHENGDQDHHSHHSDNFPMMELMTKAMYKNHIIPDYLPLTGMQEKLEKGGLEVLDVGCGVGIHICEIAQHFPKCNFTGIDIGVKGIERAKEIAKQKNLKNVKFEVISGEKMPEEWTNKFDWVMSWNSIHDHQNPQVAIKEINRVLINDGRYAMMEVNKPENSNILQNKPILSYFTVTDLFKMLAAPEATKWSNVLALELLKNAGFTKVETVETPFSDLNILFVCNK